MVQKYAVGSPTTPSYQYPFKPPLPFRNHNTGPRVEGDVRIEPIATARVMEVTGIFLTSTAVFLAKTFTLLFPTFAATQETGIHPTQSLILPCLCTIA
jgi:hypothetical protein